MRTCGNCDYWSQTCAFSEGCGPIKALCENQDSPKASRYTTERDRCDKWLAAR